MKVRGRVWIFGDDINTDVIAPGQYLKLTSQELAAHVMEGIDPSFASKVQPGDIIIAGKNFGCGSSRESAPDALKHAGIGAIVCKFSARIFYRNAINLGLPVLEYDGEFPVEEGDMVEIELESGTVTNETQGVTVQAEAFPEHIITILQKGGLVPYLEDTFRNQSTNR
ncbi:3-isopropylmalate dehydratase small subunit [Aneurinibacillus sp. REN35]|uniref:3-isopropylmalate dehydratase small subunit n=1 Tax=Aneurinibacillus sp. REN35 TaxID=3237286 RepID=UPI003526D1DC